MLKKKKQIIFDITEDANGFTLSTKLKGEIRIEHIKAVASYTNRKYSEYAAQVDKVNKDAKRAAYKKRG